MGSSRPGEGVDAESARRSKSTAAAKVVRQPRTDALAAAEEHRAKTLNPKTLNFLKTYP